MTLDGVAAIKEIEEFISNREHHHENLTSMEKYNLDVVRRDVVQSIFQQHDAWLFSEFDRLKLVELEYLYQVRGVRQVMPSAIFREGYEGYGNSWTGSKIRLLYPQDRKRGGRESREPFLPINKVLETVGLTEQLVPLRIDLSTEKYRLQDRVLWNVDDTTIPLELFVENVLEDYGLPLSLASDVCSSLQEQISSHLPHIYPNPKAAAEAAHSNANDAGNAGETAVDNVKTEDSDRMEVSEVPAGDADVVDAGIRDSDNQDAGDSGNRDAESIAGKGDSNVDDAGDHDSGEHDASGAGSQGAADIADKDTGNESHTVDASNAPNTDNSAGLGDAPSTASGVEVDIAGPADVEMTDSDVAGGNGVGGNKPAAGANGIYDEDLRITIKLDITIGQHQLVDQFEWDINNPDNDPEMFGLILAAELSLPLEFSTAVSHAIREQSQAYTRALFSSGYQFDGKPPQDQQLQNETAMPVGAGSFLRRPELLPLFSPALNDVKISGLDPDELEAEKREMRSRRRQGRSSRRNHHGHHHHDTRAGNSALSSGDLINLAQDHRGPDFCTPIYSSVLPGGLDRNLSILHMTVCQNDESYGGDKQDLVYYFHKHRREHKVQSAAQFETDMMKVDKPRWIVKMKLPRPAATADETAMPID